MLNYTVTSIYIITTGSYVNINLTEDELHALNRIVTAYIEFAELQALRLKVMTMGDWIVKLDDFLKLSEHELLDYAGMISAEAAKAKAELECEYYRSLTEAQPRPVDRDFEQAVKQLGKLPKLKKPRGSKSSTTI